MRRGGFIVHTALSWIVLAVGCLDIFLALATSQIREGALVMLAANLHLPMDVPGVIEAIARCNKSLVSLSGWHFFTGLAAFLAGGLLVATNPAKPDAVCPENKADDAEP